MRLSRALETTFIGIVSKLSYHIAIPQDIATKTFEYYLRTISSLVRELYRGDIEEGDFIGSMADLIQAQLTRAWHEGMRENGLDPTQDMEPEWQEVLDKAILSEYDYVDSFAVDIIAARDPDIPEQEGWEPLLARAAIWANRYNDIVSLSILTTKEQKLRWNLGATEKHCKTCGNLNGIVALASIWELSDVRPQHPPNTALECGGWQCDCNLTPTNERQTRNAWNMIMKAVGLR